MSDSVELPPTPPTSSELRQEQQEFVRQWDGVRRVRNLAAAVAILTAIGNAGGAVAAGRRGDWLVAVLSILWAVMAVGGRFLISRASAAWYEAAITRVDRARAYELAEQWRTLYLQATDQEVERGAP